MKTFISNLIPKMQRYSQQLDDLTLLTKQHWVVVDGNSDTKQVYIFRENNTLLISQNGQVEKARWEYLGHKTVLIERKDGIHLFKQGFFNESILVLKIDGRDEYVFLVNETKYAVEFSSPERIIDFINKQYYALPATAAERVPSPSLNLYPDTFDIMEGEMEIIQKGSQYMALLNNRPAPDGKYKLDDMWYLHVKNGIVFQESDS
ncbi:hypothetical protein [Pontibacter roseus]|uniref:hypothetical protein n=1 Tax=Pontibacter roseus TaxID=336989 RepID=UPI00035FD6C0|nr:hypothetical protein [Pontibacter roseus]